GPSSPPGPDVRPHELPTAVARFATLLRQHGLPVTLIHTTDAVRALDHLDIGDRGELYLAFKAIFVGRPEEVPAFDRCFDAFWRTLRANPTRGDLIELR